MSLNTEKGENKERRHLRSSSSSSLRRSAGRNRKRLRACSSNDLRDLSDEVQDPDGYRSDTSDNGTDDVVNEDFEGDSGSNSCPKIVKTDSETSVSRLKRSLSGKFRGGSSKVSDVATDDSLLKLINQNLSAKQFTKQLKRNGLDLKQNAEGQTLLHLCASKGLEEYVRVIVKKGIDVNVQDKQGYTPLLCAASNRNLVCCDALLESKTIDVTLTNLQDSNCLHYLVRIPIDEGNLVLYRKVLDSIIEKGGDINQQNRNLETPIHTACINGLNIRAVAFLLERGADCNLPTQSGETALHYAVHNFSVTLVRLLMENGADPTARAAGTLSDESRNVVDIAEDYRFLDILDCIQSILEEELMIEECANTFNSSRARINEACIIKEDYLDVMWDAEWERVFVRLNGHRIICYHEKGDIKPVYQLRLANTEVASEQGSIMMDDGEQLWCFSIVEVNGKMISFALKNPEESEDWLDAIEGIIEERSELFDMYERLKIHSKTRKNLRFKERNLAVEACITGCNRFIAAKSITELFDYICQFPVQATAALCSACTHTESGKVYQDLVAYLIHKDLFVLFMKHAFTHEIRTTAVGETLFREMSFCTRMFAAYLDTEPGRDYLRRCVTPLLEEIASSTPDSDAASVRVDGSPSMQVNVARIVSASEKFLNHVVTSSNDCPLEFRELMLHVRCQVSKFFPNMTHAVVGGFVFLRFLCPGIITPRTMGPKIPDKSRREVVLITKLLQTVSNGVEFDGTKEEYMKQFNPFVNRNRLLFTFYFDNLTNADSVKKQKDLQGFLDKQKKPVKQDGDIEYRVYEWVKSLQSTMEELRSVPSKICVAFEAEDSDDVNDCPDVSLDS